MKKKLLVIGISAALLIVGSGVSVLSMKDKETEKPQVSSVVASKDSEKITNVVTPVKEVAPVEVEVVEPIQSTQPEETVPPPVPEPKTFDDFITYYEFDKDYRKKACAVIYASKYPRLFDQENIASSFKIIDFNLAQANTPETELLVDYFCSRIVFI